MKKEMFDRIISKIPTEELAIRVSGVEGHGMNGTGGVVFENTFNEEDGGYTIERVESFLDIVEIDYVYYSRKNYHTKGIFRNKKFRTIYLPYENIMWVERVRNSKEK